MLDILGDPEAVEFWTYLFDKIHTEGIECDGWDWPWLFACWAHRGLSILPATNLITNIGFGEDATHTKRADDERAFVPAIAMPFPLRHPPHLVRDVGADKRIVEQVGLRRQRRGVHQRVRRRCLAALPRPVRESLSAVKATLGSYG